MRYLLAYFWIIASIVTAQESSPFSAGSVTVDGKALHYRLLSPAKLKEGQTYPLVLFLHGAGERGKDNKAQLTYLPRRMLELQESMPCFLLAPQCPRGMKWNDVSWETMRPARLSQPMTWTQRSLVSALQKVVRSNPVHTDRIYLTGLSMGGFGSWELAARFPGWFAACVPICGGGAPEFAPRLVGLPTWAWHGGRDRVVPASGSSSQVKSIREAGSKVVQYTELKGVGHNSWSAAYGKKGALNWMFKQRKSAERPLPGLEMIRRTKSIRKGERIAFFGDSITQAGARPGGYVDLIKQVLASRKDLEDVEVIPAGISGHRVPDLEKRLERDILSKGATVVFIYIGINDVWHSQSGRGTSADDFRAGLIRIIDKIQATKATVILATPTTIGERLVGENSLDTMLEDYSAISRLIAKKKKTTLVDLRSEMTNHLRIVNQANKERGILTGDGVHLNVAGNRFLADQAARGIVSALENR